MPPGNSCWLPTARRRRCSPPTTRWPWECSTPCTSADSRRRTTLSIVGFDDIPESAYFSPSLTTVRQDFNAMGRRGVDLLIGILTAEVAPAHQFHLIEPELIVRSSTGRPRVP